MSHKKETFSGSTTYPCGETQDQEIKKGLINQLPKGVLGIIISYLDGRSLESAVCVSKRWKDITIETVKTKTNASLKVFAKSFQENLNKDLYASEIEMLLGILEDTKIENCVNLKDIKSKSTLLKLKITEEMFWKIK